MKLAKHNGRPTRWGETRESAAILIASLLVLILAYRSTGPGVQPEWGSAATIIAITANGINQVLMLRRCDKKHIERSRGFRLLTGYDGPLVCVRFHGSEMRIGSVACRGRYQPRDFVPRSLRFDEETRTILGEFADERYGKLAASAVEYESIVRTNQMSQRLRTAFEKWANMESTDRESIMFIGQAPWHPKQVLPWAAALAAISLIPLPGLLVCWPGAVFFGLIASLFWIRIVLESRRRKNFRIERRR